MFGLFGGPKYELGKGTVIAISGCKDEQTSGDALRIAKYFELPPGVGVDGAGGACTNGLIRIVFAKDKTMAQFDGTWGDLLVQLRKSLQQATSDAGKQVFSQIPQLTASYDLPLAENFELLNRAAPSPLKWELVVQPVGRQLGGEPSPSPGVSLLVTALTTKTGGGVKPVVELTQKEWDDCGIKGLRDDHFVTVGTASYRPVAGPKRTKALLIGINYTAIKGSELRGSHNDVKLIKKFITQMGFTDTPQTMKVLLDDGDKATGDPTKQNIIAALKWLVQGAAPGDSLFLHYSGHGSQVDDLDGDEKSGMDQTLVPLDFKKFPGKDGHIIDDDIHKILVAQLPEGCKLFCLFDCCHSGTMLDLPYTIKLTPELESKIVKGTAKMEQQDTAKMESKVNDAKTPAPGTGFCLGHEASTTDAKSNGKVMSGGAAGSASGMSSHIIVLLIAVMAAAAFGVLGMGGSKPHEGVQQPKKGWGFFRRK
jgi:hypothetical protein